MSFIQLTVNASYDKSAAKQYSQYGLEWGEQEQDFRNRYSKLPLERYAYDVMLRRGFSLFGEFGMSLSYIFADKSVSGDRTLYRLDKYKGWDSFNGHSLGYLPSTQDSLQQTMDWQNSYFSTETSMKHTSEISFGYHLPGKSQSYLSLDLPVNIVQDKLSYRRAALDTLARRNKTFFTPTLSYISNCYSERNGMKYNASTEFSYSFVPSAPRLLSLLDIRDDSNPLSIQLGNPYLKNEKIHRIKFRHTHNSQEKQRNLGLNVNWEMRLGAIGQSMMYDKESGVKTYTPKNINGNWNAGISFNYGQAVDKKQRWQLSTATDARYINSVDWVSTSGLDNSVRSSVRNVNLSETLKADFRLDELYIGIKAGGKWIYATSGRENFTTINSVDMNYGISAVVPLVWKFKLSTNLTLFSRRGYDDRSMNTDDVVWNATLSHSFLKGNLTCSIDGFDLLRQLSSIYQTVNVQGRTETWYNSLPRYYLFRAMYRLNKQPKKK